jgi:SpoIID/LytB domain protein
MRRALVLLAATGMLLGQPGAPRANQDARPVWAIVDWATGAVVSSSGIERLQAPVQPGSLVKMATLVAAVEAGIVTGSTRVRCDGEARVEGEVVRCSHPRMRHPLRPAEALALSCNVWFATIGSRVPRARLDARLVSLGLPSTPRRAPMPLAATGLRATASPPLAWIEALRRLVGPEASIDARTLLVEGLRGAALFGTASAFSERGLDALAKTGTAEGAARSTLGVVVAAWPAGAPTRGIVLVGAGIAGRDAADLAAEIVRDARTTHATPAPDPSTTRPTPRTAPGSTSLKVGTSRAGGVEVREYELDDYVARVLAGEAAAQSPAAALDALAIAVRTFALANRGRHGRDGYDVCTLTHCQVLRDPYDAARGASARTRGQVLVGESGQPAEVFYTASCGGRTERPSEVWPRAVDPPYLPSRSDRACGGEPRWAAEIPVQDLERTLAGAGYRGGRLRGLEVGARSASGRATVVKLEGLVPATISGQDFRMIVGRALGWHLLKSTAFEVRRTGTGYRFDGRGFGHGVGLCVLGSVARARSGDDAGEILKQYFPGLEVSRLQQQLATAVSVEPARPVGPAPPAAAPPAPGAALTRLTLSLPAVSEPERAALSAFIVSSASAVARATAMTVPADVQVVVHPSSASFQRETAESWWSAARTRGTRIDLLPLPVLRERGTLEATVRHELVHVMTEPALSAAPRWVKEGVAMHFAGERPPASLMDGQMPRRVKCPSDEELGRAVSATAARDAYARAAACVARAIAEGKDWRTLR